MNLYERFLALPIDRECLGLEPRDTDISHFCTPKGANILGWAGVDGVHYCTVPLLGKTIFAVTPMDGPVYVRPIARNWSDLLSLLLACGSMDAIAQVFIMDEDRFANFVAENPPLPDQQAAMDVIARELCITPMPAPYEYLNELQNGFYYPSIPYTEEYYDTTGEPAPQPWTVTWNGSFGHADGESGEEIPVDKTVRWGEDLWHIPSVYRFPEGLIIDFCIEIDPDRVRAFVDRWDLHHEAEHPYTPARRQQIEADNPMHIDFRKKLTCNGEEILQKHGRGMSWLAPDCLEEPSCFDTDALAVLEHYNLDPNRCWSFFRTTFPREDPDSIDTLTLHLERHPTELPAAAIHTPKMGDSFTITHPLTGKVHRLTIHEVEGQEMDHSRFSDPELELPTHYTAMTYTLEPDLPNSAFSFRDMAQSDGARRKDGRRGGAVSIGIIGSARSPVILLTPDGSEAKLHTTCSAMHFEPVSDTLWQFSFREKLLADAEIRLI